MWGANLGKLDTQNKLWGGMDLGAGRAMDLAHWMPHRVGRRVADQGQRRAF